MTSLQKNYKNTPCNDFIFQKIFAKKGNEEMLTEILEEVLEIKINKIEIDREVTLERELEKEKYGRIDIKATINEDGIVNCEMQVEDNKNMIERTLFYGTKLYAQDLKESEQYESHKKVIVISILAYNLFEDGDYMVSGRMRRDDTKEILTNNLQLYYIQLPKFLKQDDKKRKKLSNWLHFIIQDKKGVKIAMKENDKIAKAQKQLEEILSDPEVRRGIERREEAKTLEVLDFNCAWFGGKAEGEKEGIEKNKIEIAKKMLEKGMSIKQIEDITELTEKEIKKLQKDKEQDTER